MNSRLKIELKDKVVTEEAEYRISQVMKTGQIVLENLSGGENVLMNVSELTERYADRKLAIVRFDGHGRVSTREALRSYAYEPNTGVDVRSRIRQLMLQEFDKTPVPLSDKSLKKFIIEVSLPKELVQENWRPSAGTLRRDIKQRGASGYRTLSLMKRKRRRANESPFCAETLLLMNSIVRWYYGARHRSIDDAYAKFSKIHDYLESRNCRDRGMIKRWKKPSNETLRVRIRSSESFEFIGAKWGKKEARRRYKGVGNGMRAERPLDIVMIDATVIDTFLVYDDGKILGRPTLTVGIDVCTRMIVGLYISFEPASIYSVMNCVRDILTPKEAYLKSRFPELRNSFVAFGKPFLIVADNGLENVGASFQDTMHDLNMNVEWAPVKTPTYKAIVEKFFDTLNKSVFHKLGGAVPYGVKEMREREIDPAKTACMTLSALQEVIYQYIVEVYQMQMHEGIGAAPLQKWKQLTQKSGIDVIDDLKAIDDACGYVKEAILTRKGVEVEGLRFNDQMITTHLLQDLLPIEPRGRKRRAIESVRVKIKFDPSDVSAIRVWNSVSGQYVVLPNRQPTYAAGTSLWLHRMLKKNAAADQQAFFSDAKRYAAKARLLKALERGTLRGFGSNGSKRLRPQLHGFSAVIKSAEAPPRHDGNAPLVRVEVGMHTRSDEGAKPNGFVRGRAKADATRRRNKVRRIEDMQEACGALSNSRTAFEGLELDNPDSFMAEIGEGWK